MGKKEEIRDFLINLSDEGLFSYIANFHTDNINDVLNGNLCINFNYSIDVNSKARADQAYKTIFNLDDDNYFNTLLIYALPSNILKSFYDFTKDNLHECVFKANIDEKFLYASVDLNTLEIRYNDDSIVKTYENRHM